MSDLTDDLVPIDVFPVSRRQVVEMAAHGAGQAIASYLVSRAEGLDHAQAFDVAVTEAEETAADLVGLDSFEIVDVDILDDPTEITSADLRTMVMQGDDEVRCQGCEDAPVGMTVRHDVRCPRHGYTAQDDICDCPFCQECGMAFVEDGS